MKIPVHKFNSVVAFVEVDDADYIELSKHYWTLSPQGYARSTIAPNVREYMHRLVLSRKLGRELIGGMQCDHFDENKSNNTRENLSEITLGENVSRSSVKTNMNPVRVAQREKARDISLVQFSDPRQREMQKEAKRHIMKAVEATKLSTGERFMFESMIEASRKLSVTMCGIGKVLKGEQPSTKGFVFKRIPAPQQQQG